MEKSITVKLEMILLLIGLGILAFLVHQFWYRRLGLPPGPIPLPLLGNIHSLWSYNRWEDKFLEWKKEYGNIYTFWIGPIPMITVNSYEKCVELFVKDGDTFVDRAPLELLGKLLNGGSYGVFETSGPLWLEQRRFAIRVLRDFGLGKNKMQERILEEFETLSEHVQNDIKMGIKEHSLYMHTEIATGSIINVVLTGYRFTNNGNESKFFKLKELTAKVFSGFADPILLLAITSERLLKLPVFREKFRSLLDSFREIFDIMGDVIDQHEEWLQGAGDDVEPRDFVDAYLLEQKKMEEKGEKHYFSRVQLLNTLTDLWFAGQESTSSTLTWSFAYLIENEEVQKRMHDELDAVIGSDRLITSSDRQQLPYTNAVIMNFQNPQKFDPSRFIDKNGQLKKCDELLPFSLGKRVCLGESLARMELFLLTANIFNRFKLSAGKKRPTFKKVGSGAGFGTEPYKVRIEQRH